VGKLFIIGSVEGVDLSVPGGVFGSETALSAIIRMSQSVNCFFPLSQDLNDSKSPGRPMLTESLLGNGSACCKTDACHIDTECSAFVVHLSRSVHSLSCGRTCHPFHCL
jgi:hypothetical protein